MNDAAATSGITGVPVLETARMILRGPRLEDFDAFAAHCASPRARYEYGELGRAEAWRVFASSAALWMLKGYGPWSLQHRETTAYLGEVGIYHPAHYPEPELGWTLMAEAEGRGYALEAAVAARRYAYQTFGWHTLVSYIDSRNDRSIRLAERLAARLDRDAPYPEDDPCDVYRHPAPDELAE